MTHLLQHAFETVRRLPPKAQDHIAEAMLALAGEEPAGFSSSLCRAMRRRRKKSLR